LIFGEYSLRITSVLLSLKKNVLLAYWEMLTCVFGAQV